MGILSKLLGKNPEDEYIPIHPNQNSIKLADLALSHLVLSRPGFRLFVDPALRSPQKRKFVWAYFYGFVVGLGIGCNMSVTEVENAAYLVFQTFFGMNKQDASCSIGLVQSMSETEEGLRYMTAGKDSIDRYMSNQSQMPVDYNELAFLIGDLG
jgi:hypothetical protein